MKRHTPHSFEEQAATDQELPTEDKCNPKKLKTVEQYTTEHEQYQESTNLAVNLLLLEDKAHINTQNDKPSSPPTTPLENPDSPVPNLKDLKDLDQNERKNKDKDMPQELSVQTQTQAHQQSTTKEEDRGRERLKNRIAFTKWFAQDTSEDPWSPAFPQHGIGRPAEDEAKRKVADRIDKIWPGCG